MTTNADMNSMIRAAARQDRIEAGPKPQMSTPSDQPRPADVNAAATGAGMGTSFGDPNTASMRAWSRERGLEPVSFNEHMRSLVAEKRLGRRPGWR